MFHAREDRICAHIRLCWLALLLIRTIENATGDTWRNVRHELQRMHLVTYDVDGARVTQRTVTTEGQRGIFSVLEVHEPSQFQDIVLPKPAA